MKKLILLVAFSAFAVGTKAQLTTDEASLLQANFGLEKKQIITKYMKLTKEEEAAGFWKMYEEYEAERKAVGKKRIDNLVEYTSNSKNLTNEKVTELLNNSLAIQTSFTELWKATFEKASKVLTPTRAGQFIQMEMYLENAVRMEIADEIPMIGELKKSKKK